MPNPKKGESAKKRRKDAERLPHKKLTMRATSRAQARGAHVCRATRVNEKTRNQPRSRFFTVPIYADDIPLARSMIGRTIGYDTSSGFTPVDVVDIAVYDPSHGAMTGQLFAVVELTRSAPIGVLTAYFGDATVICSNAADAFVWKKLFTRIDL